jgi:xylulokinase
MEYVISVDIGTQGTKAGVLDKRLRLISSAFVPSDLLRPDGQTVYQKPEDIFSSVIRTVKEAVIKANVRKEEIRGLAMDSQMAGILGIGDDGQATTYYDSWLDMRSAPFLKTIEGTLGDKAVLSSGGQLAANQASKILWWKEKHPEVYQATKAFVLPHAYVALRLAKEDSSHAFFDYTCLHFNSFSDNRRKCFPAEIAGLFGIDPSKLPRVVSPFEPIGVLSKEAADLTGLSQGMPIFSGLGDSAASTFGSGAYAPGIIQDTAGTASLLSATVSDFFPDVGSHVYNLMRSPIDGLFLASSYISGGGLCLPWFLKIASLKGECHYGLAEKEASVSLPGAGGVFFCPHFNGRILPSDPNLRGSFSGLSPTTTRGDMYRSIMESIAFEYAIFLSAIKKNYPDLEFREVITNGGGSKSDLFSQIKADVLGLPLRTFAKAETALIGTACVAFMSLGLIQDYPSAIRSSNKEKKRFMPDVESHAFYEKRGIQYQKFIDAISAIPNNC